MATRGRATFQKRQKEMARKEKQRMKAERRAQRKAGLLPSDGAHPEDAIGPTEPSLDTELSAEAKD